MEQVTKYRLICPYCNQEGILVEKERREILEHSAPGECSDDMSVYYYQFTVEAGDFKVIHKDPNSFDHSVICNKCSKEVKEERIKQEA